MVFRLDENVVVKVTFENYAVTEYGNLLFLQEKLPDFPAPRPHGLVRFGPRCLIFTGFIRGLDLEKAWPRLEERQKQDLSDQIDSLLVRLRSLPPPSSMQFGTPQGGLCKDARRGVRVSSESITSTKQFQDFMFSGSKTASDIYTKFLRNLMPDDRGQCVFTHGDIRPANIMVDEDGGGTWRVVAVIDWESSGFYPEYWESVKMTNNLSLKEHSDW